MISQLVDSVAVIFITYSYAKYALPIEESEPIFGQLLVFVFSAYIFKFAIALLDTFPFYAGVKILSKYLEINPNAGYADKEKEEEDESSSM